MAPEAAPTKMPIGEQKLYTGCDTAFSSAKPIKCKEDHLIHPYKDGMTYVTTCNNYQENLNYFTGVSYYFANGGYCTLDDKASTPAGTPA